MMKQVAAAVVLAIAVFLIAPATAFGKQQCRASKPATAHGYWSWRLIDDRKCWYEGRPGLSKSSLEWPSQAAAPPHRDEEIAITPVETPDPMDAQARATDPGPSDSGTFDAMWRARIDRH